MMETLAPESDSALITNNGSNLRLLFKVFEYLYQMQLPFIHNKRLHAAFVQAVKGCKQEAERLLNDNDRINLCEVNEYFVKVGNALNDSLN